MIQIANTRPTTVDEFKRGQEQEKRSEDRKKRKWKTKEEESCQK